jgi:Ca2+-transporting ATPase
VLRVDNTGTLTRNRMTARWLIARAEPLDLLSAGTASGATPEWIDVLPEHVMLASRPDAFDPMDRALIDAGARVLGGTKHLHRKWSLERKSPMASDRLAVVHA